MQLHPLISQRLFMQQSVGYNEISVHPVISFSKLYKNALFPMLHRRSVIDRPRRPPCHWLSPGTETERPRPRAADHSCKRFEVGILVRKSSSCPSCQAAARSFFLSANEERYGQLLPLPLVPIRNFGTFLQPTQVPDAPSW